MDREGFENSDLRFYVPNGYGAVLIVFSAIQ
jgi:hypothetical protein